MSGAPNATSDAYKRFFALRNRFLTAIRRCRSLKSTEKVVAWEMVERTSSQLFFDHGVLITWISVGELMERLGETESTVQRARRAMRTIHLVEVHREGGRGPKDTAGMGFSLAWLEKEEAALLRGHAPAIPGLEELAAAADMGGMDDTLSTADTLDGGASGKGGADDTLNTCDTLGRDAEGGMGDTLVACDTLGRPAEGGVGDTLTSRGPVEKAPASVENMGVVVDKHDQALGGAGLRVSNMPPKGGIDAGKRVSRMTPENISINNPSTGRGGARERKAPGGADAVDRAQRSLPLVRSIPGGISHAIEAARTDARRLGDGKAEQRLQTLLHRSAFLLGDQRRGSLAVAVLSSHDPTLYAAILRGQTIRDQDLRAALDGALAAAEGTGDAPPAPAIAAAPAGEVDQLTALIDARLDARLAPMMAILQQIAGQLPGGGLAQAG